MNEPPAPDTPPPPEPIGGEAAQPSAKPAEETAAVAPPAVECPGCGAKLRNISIGTSVKIRCLNCGIRFSPFQASDATHATASRESTVQPDESKPKIREPKSAGYWLLRIPAILYAAGISCAFVATVINLFYEIFFRQSRYSGRTYEYLLPLLYTPLMPLSAYYLFVATRALARLEARTLKAAWNDKLIQHSLPAAPGSSLPYILPLAAGPMVLFIASVVISMNRNYLRMSDDIVFFGIASAACFFLAFMIDDFRQFIWRQRSMADACAEDASVKSGTRSDSRFPLLGLLPAVTIVAFALENYIQYQPRYQDYERQVIGLLTALGCAVTLFLTGRNFQNATNAWWSSAASVLGRGSVAMKEREAPDIPGTLMRIILIVFAIVGTIIILCMAFRNGPLNSLDVGFVFLWLFCTFFTCISIARLYHVSKAGGSHFAVYFYLFVTILSLAPLFIFPIGDSRQTYRAVGFSFAICGGNLACLTLSQVYAVVRRWRRAQTVFWKLRKNLTAEPALPTLPRVIFAATFVLTIIQFIALSSFIYYQVFFRFRGRSSEPWEMVIGIPLIAFMTTFPTIWVALMAREFMLAEEMARQLRPAPAGGSAAD